VNPTWLEDPTPPSPSSLAAIARQTTVPIATGENTYRLEGFIELVESGAVHILQPDFQKVGGLLEGLRVADYAARNHLPIAPHCIASPLGFMASAQVCAATTNTISLEFHGMDVPFWEALVIGDTPIIPAGRVDVTDVPGIGVELDMAIVALYAKAGEPVFDGPPVR